MRTFASASPPLCRRSMSKFAALPYQSPCAHITASASRTVAKGSASTVMRLPSTIS